jgi:hypothetical protein
MIVRDTDDSPHEHFLDHPMLCELLHPDKVVGA